MHLNQLQEAPSRSWRRRFDRIWLQPTWRTIWLLLVWYLMHWCWFGCLSSNINKKKGISEEKASAVAAKWRTGLADLSRTAAGQTLTVNELVDMDWRFGGMWWRWWIENDMFSSLMIPGWKNCYVDYLFPSHPSDCCFFRNAASWCYILAVEISVEQGQQDRERLYGYA